MVNLVTAPPLVVKNHRQEKSLFILRLRCIVGLLSVLMGVVVFRLAYLQGYASLHYKKLSEKNRLKWSPEPAQRGRIFDRQGRLLAGNVAAYRLDIVPEKAGNLKHTLSIVTDHLALPTATVVRFWKKRQHTRPYTTITLVDDLSESQRIAYYLHRYHLPGVFITPYLRRVYPFTASLFPVLGYVGYTEHRLPHAPPYSDWQGKAGLEKQYDTQLHGQTGHAEREVNAHGQTVRVTQVHPPTPGKDLTISIDARLQVAAYRALAGLQGAVVALNPQNGEILALVSAPSPDPNRLIDRSNRRYWQAVSNDIHTPLFNRALAGQYPIASPIKPFIALYALENHYIHAHTRINDPGWYRPPGTQHIYYDLHRHGLVDMHKAIMMSCDTYFYALAMRMKIQGIQSAITPFGFGKKIQIGFSEEAAGLVPNPQWKKQHMKQPWYLGDTIVAGIGQGYLLATPLQMAYATAILAARGKRCHPTLHVGASLTPPSASQTCTDKTQRLPALTLSTAHWQAVVQAMAAVIRDRHGTGFRFGRHPDYPVAGKTGTAQLYHINRHRTTRFAIPWTLKDDSWFIAFAPIAHPRIALAVLVAHSPAAPRVARQVMDAFFHPPSRQPKQ